MSLVVEGKMDEEDTTDTESEKLSVEESKEKSTEETEENIEDGNNSLKSHFKNIKNVNISVSISYDLFFLFFQLLITYTLWVYFLKEIFFDELHSYVVTVFYATTVFIINYFVYFIYLNQFFPTNSDLNSEKQSDEKEDRLLKTILSLLFIVVFYAIFFLLVYFIPKIPLLFSLVILFYVFIAFTESKKKPILENLILFIPLITLHFVFLPLLFFPGDLSINYLPIYLFIISSYLLLLVYVYCLFYEKVYNKNKGQKEFSVYIERILLVAIVFLFSQVIISGSDIIFRPEIEINPPP